MGNTTIYDLIILHDFFARKKEPTQREKAAVDDLNEHLLSTVESIQAVGLLPRG